MHGAGKSVGTHQVLYRTPSRKPGSKEQKLNAHLSSIQNLCWLMIKEDYTSQFIGDLNNPTRESLQTNQCNRTIEGFWTLLNCIQLRVAAHISWWPYPDSSILEVVPPLFVTAKTILRIRDNWINMEGYLRFNGSLQTSQMVCWMILRSHAQFHWGDFPDATRPCLTVWRGALHDTCRHETMPTMVRCWDVSFLIQMDIWE